VSGSCRRAARLAAAAWLAAAASVLALACGETRRPLGDECLRDDDCLSSVCAGRVCAAAPPLTSEQLGPPNRSAQLPDSSPALPGDAGGG
jgi:hypothetical protein